MGCDIHSFAEKKNQNGQYIIIEDLCPFDWRSYSVFGFLAGVRNYSNIIPISTPRGLPDDVCQEIKDDFESRGYDAHSASWLSIKELTDFEYDKETEDCRVTINGDGGCTCDPGGGKKQTYREFLRSEFFDEIKKLKEAKAERIVFYFDN
ncbi:MAG: hypothetical protein WC888_04550 [Candidatus Izemoplasmatales bacterium]|jgi:hypothetical protein